MVLDTLEKDRVNIKDITLDEPRETNPFLFDPTKEINSETWQRLMGYFEGLRESKYWEQVLRNGALITIIDPTRIKQSNLANEDLNQTLNYVKEFDEERRSNSPQDIANLMFLRILSPEKAKQYEKEVDYDWKLRFFEHYIPARQKGLMDLVQKQDPRHSDPYFREFYHIKMAFPNQFEFNIPSEAILAEVKYVRSRYKNSEGVLGDLGDLNAFLTSASAIKVLLPERFNGLGVLDNDSWQFAKEGLDKYFSVIGSPGVEGMFLNMAACMRIVSAKEVKMSDQGLELVMPTKSLLVESTPALPETRKF